MWRHPREVSILLVQPGGLISRAAIAATGRMMHDIDNRAHGAAYLAPDDRVAGMRLHPSNPIKRLHALDFLACTLALALITLLHHLDMLKIAVFTQIP